MKACVIIVTLFRLCSTQAFLVVPNKKMTTRLNMVEKVEVCSFKDCKRNGGGPRLQKLVNEVRVVSSNQECVAETSSRYRRARD